jgi:hypothetical protein
VLLLLACGGSTVPGVCSLLVDRLHKLPYYERNTLNSLDLFLCSHKFTLQTPLLIFDVLFLEMDVPVPVSHQDIMIAGGFGLTLTASAAS